MTKPRAVQLSPLASIADLMPGAQWVAFAAGPDNSVLLGGALKPLDYRTEVEGWATFAKTVPDSPQDYRIVRLNEGIITLDLTVQNVAFNVHQVQIVGDELLLICGRSYRRSATDIELNGHFYTLDGQPSRSVLLGDGIADVQATGDGTIWTSFFDEGIFGNYGWDNPVGASGLVAWDATGNKRYEYEPTAGLDSMCDCYALNVASDTETWCYYYTQFPLVLLRRNVIEAHWQVPVRGSHAFAVSYPHALFQGGYDDHDTYHLYKLESDGTVTLVADITLQDETGRPLSADRVIGRGDTLYLIAQGSLYAVALWQLFGA